MSTEIKPGDFVKLPRTRTENHEKVPIPTLGITAFRCDVVPVQCLAKVLQVNRSSECLVEVLLENRHGGSYQKTPVDLYTVKSSELTHLTPFELAALAEQELLG